MAKKPIDKWQYGDFQTPLELAREVVDALKRNHDIRPSVVIEPTCGRGAFVQAASEGFDACDILGFEINPVYAAEARRVAEALAGRDRIVIQEADFFDTNWEAVIAGLVGPILILGNPPWVTSSELGALNSKNLPEKSNFQGRKGFAAITGAGNFDISEWMLLRHVEWLTEHSGAIAYLCKYSVARKVMRQVRARAEERFFGHIYRIDAKYHFGASVEACLFVLTTDGGHADCEVYSSLDALSPSSIFGARDGFVVKDVKRYEEWRHLRGEDSLYVWRSGLKHDCAKVMELEVVADGYRNGLGESVDLEGDYIYPLLKSSDVGNGRINRFRKMVLVTQKTVGEDTSVIGQRAPRTWDYLCRHAASLDNRRSSIYRNRPRFSEFGLGSYTFKPWKVAISGLYKRLHFEVIGPLGGKSVVFDDTVNFLSFDTEEEAHFVYRLLTSAPALEFFDAMIFWDEKRPITTEVLRRLSLCEVARVLRVGKEFARWRAERSSAMESQLELIQ